MDTIDLIEQYMSSLNLDLNLSHIRKVYENIDHGGDYSYLLSKNIKVGSDFPKRSACKYLMIGERRSGKTTFLLEKVKFFLNTEENICINLILPYNHGIFEREFLGCDFGPIKRVALNRYINSHTSSVLNILFVSHGVSNLSTLYHGHFNKTYIFIDDVFDLPTRYFLDILRNSRSDFDGSLNLIAVGDLKTRLSDSLGWILLMIDDLLLKKYDLKHKTIPTLDESRLYSLFNTTLPITYHATWGVTD